MAQNKSHAVMAQRHEADDSLDDFPTPPWATRALMHHVIGPDHRKEHVWEPACNRGAMVKPLLEHFGQVSLSDVHDYGAGFDVEDFLSIGNPRYYPDFIITNPPFRLGEEFIARAMENIENRMRCAGAHRFPGKCRAISQAFRPISSDADCLFHRARPNG